MSKADKLFMNIGYMIDEDENRTIYSNRDEDIIFDNEIRCVITGNKLAAFINMYMLNAINEKVKELGWLDE